MKNLSVTVFGIYQKSAHAMLALRNLVQAEFSESQIDVLYSDTDGTMHFLALPGSRRRLGAMSGARVGAFIGGTVGLLAGLAAIVDPPFHLVSPTAMILLSLACFVGLAALGGAAGTLIMMGRSPSAAKRYEGTVNRGDILVSVIAATPDRVSKAYACMRSSGTGLISLATQKNEKWYRLGEPFQSRRFLRR